MCITLFIVTTVLNRSRNRKHLKCKQPSECHLSKKTLLPQIVQMPVVPLLQHNTSCLLKRQIVPLHLPSPLPQVTIKILQLYMTHGFCLILPTGQIEKPVQEFSSSLTQMAKHKLFPVSFHITISKYRTVLLRSTSLLSASCLFPYFPHSPSTTWPKHQ